ncbi:MAG: hypothetical protein J1F22_00820 [Lachnospiraceae bacterium]|nr:hypothetical protein [Lachnospiraceae bacterium]
MSEKRLVLMSLKEKPWREILSGKKKYEFRTRYTASETIAFIYVSREVKAVCGIIFFGKPVIGSAEEISRLSEEINPGSYSYMMEYLSKGTGYAIPVKKVVEIKPISLETIRQKAERFVVPQSYYYLDTEKKKKLLEVLVELGEIKL